MSETIKLLISMKDEYRENCIEACDKLFSLIQNEPLDEKTENTADPDMLYMIGDAYLRAHVKAMRQVDKINRLKVLNVNNEMVGHLSMFENGQSNTVEPGETSYYLQFSCFYFYRALNLLPGISQVFFDGSFYPHMRILQAAQMNHDLILIHKVLRCEKFEIIEDACRHLCEHSLREDNINQIKFIILYIPFLSNNKKFISNLVRSAAYYQAIESLDYALNLYDDLIQSSEPELTIDQLLLEDKDCIGMSIIERIVRSSTHESTNMDILHKLLLKCNGLTDELLANINNYISSAGPTHNGCCFRNFVENELERKIDWENTKVDNPWNNMWYEF